MEIKENNGKSVSETKNNNSLIAAFMIFILPIISAILGVVLGGYIGESIGTSIIISRFIGGIVGFALAAVIMKLYANQ